MSDRPHIDSRVSTLPVRGQISVARHASRPASAESAEDAWAVPADPLDPLLPEEVAIFIRAHRVMIAVIVVVAVLTELAPDAPWVIVIPALAGSAAMRLGPRIPFSFAAGVIGPRPDLD